MNDASAPESAPAAPERSQPAGGSGLGVAAIALLFALAAIAGMAWQWFDQRAQLETLRQELAKKIAETDLQNRESRLVSDQVREATKEAQVKIGVLEAKFAESQSQQIALESLYQELSRNRDEWASAEIEQSLLIASQQLQLAGNVRAALIALQNADARLQRMDRPQLTPLRKAISRDMERLKAVPHVDVVGISARLDALIAAVEGLPLSTEVRPAQQASARQEGAPDGNAWKRFLREAWTDAKQLVRVEQMEQPGVPLLTPTQTFFLRENLKLRLIGARLALLTRDEASYRADLNAAQVWLSRYYDTGNKAVATSATTLRTLYDSPISIDLPDISATLDALRDYRRSRERGIR